MTALFKQTSKRFLVYYLVGDVTISETLGESDLSFCTQNKFVIIFRRCFILNIVGNVVRNKTQTEIFLYTNWKCQICTYWAPLGPLHATSTAHTVLCLQLCEHTIRRIINRRILLCCGDMTSTKHKRRVRFQFQHKIQQCDHHSAMLGLENCAECGGE